MRSACVGAAEGMRASWMCSRMHAHTRTHLHTLAGSIYAKEGPL